MKKKQVRTNEKPISRQSLEEIARLLLCTLISVLGFYVSVLLCARCYHPDLSSVLNEAKTLLPESMLPSVKPEPVEDLLYNIGLLYFPLSLLALYSLFSRKSSNHLLEKPLIAPSVVWLATLGVLLLAYQVFKQPNPFFEANYTSSDFQPDNFKVFFAPWLLASKPACYLFIAMVAFGIFYGLSRLSPKAYRYTDFSLGIAVYGVVLWLVFLMFRMNTYSFPDTWQGQYDLNSVYYSQTQTMAGSPLLIDGVSNTYGGYPLFLTPVFKCIGLDISNFTLVMSLLLVLCVACWAFFLNRFTRSRLIVALGLVFLLFFCYLTAYLHDFLVNAHTFDSYFAGAPIRWVAPAFCLLFATLYHSRRILVKNIAYYAAALLLPLGIIWSPDSGLVSCVAWLLFLLFQDFWKQPMLQEKTRFWNRIAWKTEGRHLAVWLGGCMVSFALVALIMRLCYHAWPEYGLLFHTAVIFGKLGFFTMPMQAWHPWILVALMFCFGLAYSMSAFCRARVQAFSSALFLLSILGCGLFAYFKSRSYHGNLMMPAMYAVMIGILFVDKLYEQIRQNKYRCLWIPCLVSLVAITAAVPESLAAHKNLQKLSGIWHGNQRPEDKHRIDKNKKFIQNYSRKTQKVWVLTSHKYQSFYFDKPLLQSAFNPGFLDLNTLEACERAERTMRDSSFTVFLDGNYFYYDAWADMRSLVAARYVVDSQCRQEDESKTFFSALNLRRERIPSIAGLNRTNEEALLYRKYTDDTIGYGNRVQDARGFPLALPANGYSLEAVFYSGKQHYSSSAVFSQYTGSDGIGLFCVDEDNKWRYGLVCGGTQAIFDLPENTWFYVALNVMPTAVDIYVNAQYYGRLPFSKAYGQGAENFCIGSHQGNAPFIGAISEIALYNRHKTPAEIAATHTKLISTLE